jgi:4-azaleucine resistance transporter AzlC
VTSGFPLWVPVTTAVLVLAGSSEFLFVGIIAAGGSPVAAVLAGLLVNARHITYGLTVSDVVGSGWRRLVGTHIMNDESVVLALAQGDPARRRAAYWLCGAGNLICWPAGALVGALAGSALRNPDALGLDAMFPAAILALILPALKKPGSRYAAIAGAAIALATAPFLPPGLPELLALAGLALTVRRRVVA